MVIRKKELTSGNQTIGYKLTLECGIGDYTLEVTFYHNIAAVPPDLTYHGLIPKLGQMEVLTVKTETNWRTGAAMIYKESMIT